MKKIFALSACVIPLMMAPAVHAQTTAPSTAPAASESNAPASTMPKSPRTAAPGSAGTPATSGTTTAPATPGNAATPSMNNETPESAEATQAITGLSVKHKIMGKSVYNETGEKIGDVEDVILATNGQVTNYVIGAGGFLGMAQHNVAIPFDKVTGTDDKLMLQGYTKDQLKALPEVKVEK